MRTKKRQRQIQTKDAITMLAISMLVLVISLPFFYTLKANTDKAEEYGVQVKATVVDERSTGRRRRGKEYTVSYQDSKGYNYESVLPLAREGFSMGEEIIIVVNSQDYNEILISGGEKHMVLVFRLALAFTFLLTAILAVLARRNSKPF